jgi:hypothetical protein
MKKDAARKILALLDDATVGLLKSLDRIDNRVEPAAYGFCKGYVGKVLGEITLGVVLPLWDQHPDLVPPKGEKSSYDPQSVFMPRREVIRLAQSLLKASDRVGSAMKVIRTSNSPAQELRPMERAMESIRAALEQGIFNLRSQHPDFRGKKPKRDLIREAKNVAASKRRRAV